MREPMTPSSDHVSRETVVVRVEDRTYRVLSETLVTSPGPIQDRDGKVIKWLEFRYVAVRVG